MSLLNVKTYLCSEKFYLYSVPEHWPVTLRGLVIISRLWDYRPRHHLHHYHFHFAGKSASETQQEEQSLNFVFKELFSCSQSHIFYVLPFAESMPIEKSWTGPLICPLACQALIS